MSLQFAKIDGLNLHVQSTQGTSGETPLVFLNSLGTDFRIWDGVSAQFPDVPQLKMDKRGHGLSDLGPIDIATLAQDVASAMESCGHSAAVICGVSVGGMIAQSLAHQRPDLVAGLILCNTGYKIGDDATWTPRINAVRKEGIMPLADGILERWFSHKYRVNYPSALSGYRNMLVRTDVEAYARTCEAIRDTDLRADSAKLDVPSICIGGSEDQATPPKVVADLANLIPRASLKIIAEVGHLPCIEAPELIAIHIKELRSKLP